MLGDTSLVLSYISLIMSNGEHLILSLLAIWCLLWRNVCFRSSAHFFDWAVCFSDVELYELLMCLEINS